MEALVMTLLTAAPMTDTAFLREFAELELARDNGYFLYSLKLSDALFKAGKPHSVLPLTNFTYLVPEPLVTERLYERIATWFKETL